MLTTHANQISKLEAQNQLMLNCLNISNPG